MPPCTGYGCTPWDDVSLGQVVGIVIYYDSSRIYSLRFIYVQDSIYKMSIHGEAIRENCQTIMLEYPNEYLTAVNGNRDSSSVVKSITFVTNMATYGPFGNQTLVYNDRKFGFLQGGKQSHWIRGFYGTLHGNGCLGSLGVFIQIQTAVQPGSSRPAAVKSEGQQK
nr:inactive protein RESTRICTED TEV MOVEMENT 1-like [Ipomoea batatas]